MSITKTITTPGGASAGWHQVQRVVFSAQTNALAVEVWSWAGEAEGLAGSPKLWVWPTTAPESCLNGSDGVALSVERWLAAQPEGLWGGGSVVAQAEHSLAQAQARKWADIKQTRDLLIFSPLATAHGNVQAAAVDSMNLLRASMGALVASQQGSTALVSLLLADNTSVQITAAQFADVAVALYEREQALRLRAQELRGWVYHPTATVQTVALIEWATESMPVAEGGSPPVEPQAQAQSGSPPFIY